MKLMILQTRFCISLILDYNAQHKLVHKQSASTVNLWTKTFGYWQQEDRKFDICLQSWNNKLQLDGSEMHKTIKTLIEQDGAANCCKWLYSSFQNTTRSLGKLFLFLCPSASLRQQAAADGCIFNTLCNCKGAHAEQVGSGIRRMLKFNSKTLNFSTLIAKPMKTFKHVSSLMISSLAGVWHQMTPSFLSPY